jgi:hypothetical protein
MRWVGLVAHMREMSNVYRIFITKSEGKKPLTVFRHIGRMILKWILRKQEWVVLDWIYLDQNMDQLWAGKNTAINAVNYSWVINHVSIELLSDICRLSLSPS